MSDHPNKEVLDFLRLRFDRVDARLVTIDRRLDELTTRVGRLERSVADLHVGLAERPLRADMRAVREEMASRAYVDARATETETLIERQFEQLNRRLDQTERSAEERLDRIETRLRPEP